MSTTALQQSGTIYVCAGSESRQDSSDGSPLLRKIDTLRSLPMFASANRDAMQRLAESSLVRRFDRGRTMHHGGGDDCVVLVQGRAKTIIPCGADCGEFALGILESGDIVYEGCWSRQRGREPGETVAIDDSVAAFLPRRAIDELVVRSPAVGLQFVRAIATKLQRVVDLAAHNACLEVADRLYRRLVELSQTRGRLTPDGLLIDHGLFQAELAAGIGASREAVNRQLAAWRARGLVATGRRSLLVIDPLGLTMAVSQAVRGNGFTIGDSCRGA